MIALRAQYKEGRIELLEPMPAGIINAQLNIVVIPDENQSDTVKPVEEYIKTAPTGEQNFRNIGIYNFFNSDEDLNVDWEEIFGLKGNKI